jgi:hypothetical protein
MDVPTSFIQLFSLTELFNMIAVQNFELTMGQMLNYIM